MAQSKPKTFPARAFLEVMLRAREGDRREGLLLRQNRGWFHVAATGHEALAAAVYALEPADMLFPYYRDRAVALARGVSDYELALAHFAKAASNSAGRTMPAHYSSPEHGIYSVATPTASQCLPAVGAAWRFKLAREPRVALTFVGDAATRQGEFYEAVAFAIQESLPAVFVVEDNGYGISTPTAALNPYTLDVLDDDHKVLVNGRDAFEMFERGEEAISKARNGGGPGVLWCELDRIVSHTSSDDHRVYRSEEEIRAAEERDPIRFLAERLIEEGELSRDEWNRMKETVRTQIDADYTRAESAPDPDPGQVTTRVFGEAPAASAPPINGDAPGTMVAAVNQVLRAALAGDERVVVFGEDVEDPKGGVFGFTKTLSTEFPGRVVNSPLAEATIVGVGAGMAAAGWRPVFEVQFVDFLLPGLNQLISQASSLRWRSNGGWQCPLVLLAPCGAYLPAGGIWHSESKEALVSHIPGIQVVVPSTPADTARLLWTAIQGGDPVLFLLPKHIFRRRLAPEGMERPLPFGRAAIRRYGNDVTVVCWGNCVELAEQAADDLDGEAGLEVIDLRTLVPCDWPAIEGSLAKTGRLVVVQEDNRTGGFGQTIIAETVAQPERWDLLLAPPQLVARADTPVPYNPLLEAAVLPSVEDVKRAVLTTLE